MRTDVFFDTNILLYFVSKEAVKAARSETLLRQGGVISPQVLNEFASASLSKTKFGLTFLEVRTSLNAVLASCLVAPLTIDTHLTGLRYAERYKLPIYDSMIIAAAVLAGCKLLYSEDMHNGLVVDGVTVTNPYKP